MISMINVRFKNLKHHGYHFKIIFMTLCAYQIKICLSVVKLSEIDRTFGNKKIIIGSLVQTVSF